MLLLFPGVTFVEVLTAVHYAKVYIKI